MSISRLVPLACLVAFAGAACAQAAKPAYDVVSIKPNKSQSNSSRSSWRDGMYQGTNVPLMMLISNAYHVRADLISGAPGWVKDGRFDIQAKVLDPDAEVMKKLTPEDRRAMLNAVLMDRFKLRAHIEVKTLPVYDLVLIKMGPKLVANNVEMSADAPKKGNMGPGSMWTSNGSISAYSVPLESLCNQLAELTERTVIDKTGLNGRFDVDVKFSPEDQQMAAGAQAGTTDAPSLFNALQEQLGLKLVSSKGPVETLVIDHVEQPVED